MAGEQPTKEFLAFFEYWQEALNHVRVPGMDNASWDRRAAQLLFQYGTTKPDFQTYMAWVMAQPKA
jgi:hypothetical protein